jgi:anti-sigma B factor antagonist
MTSGRRRPRHHSRDGVTLVPPESEAPDATDATATARDIAQHRRSHSNADHTATHTTVSELPTHFQISSTPDGLTVVGEVDAHTAPALRDAADDLLVERTDLRVDMRNVEFIDSSGLGVLVSITEAARDAGGDLVLVAPSRAVVRLLELSGLAEHIHVEQPG